MSGNKPLQDNPDAVAPTVEALLVPAHVAGPMCGRSKASWWRDHTAGRIPAPIKLGGRSLWRVEELRRWVEAGCPSRTVWEGGAGDQQGRPEMNLDDLPEFVPIAFLEGYGITAEDVRRRCPLAVEYGLASAPYWHRDDLAQLLIGPARGNEE